MDDTQNQQNTQDQTAGGGNITTPAPVTPTAPAPTVSGEQTTAAETPAETPAESEPAGTVPATETA